MILQVVPGDLGLDLTRGRWGAAFEDLWGLQSKLQNISVKLTAFLLLRFT